MASKSSGLVELTRMRSRGQRPEGGLVIVGDNSAWAARNRFLFVDVRDLGDDLLAFAGLLPIVRMANPGRYREVWQRLALVAQLVTVFDTRNAHTEYLAA